MTLRPPGSAGLEPLSKLAVLYGTDKFGYHDYTPNYHYLLADLRDLPIRILEIGVGGYGDEDRGGNLLAVWRDYFTKGTIVGVDIHKKTIDLGSRVTICQGSQIDPDFLDQLVAEHGPFDVIIDDGSHRNEHVVASFNYLWPTLSPDGFYLVEDVQTAFFPRFGGSISLDQPNSVGFFLDLFLRAGGTDDDPATAEIGRISRFHNIVALQKKPASGKIHRPISEAKTLDKVHAFGSARQLDEAITKLESPGILSFEGPVGPDHLLAETLAEKWVQIDHREIAVHFPDRPMNPLAKHIFSIEKFGNIVQLTKAPNDYPSNFAFDPDQPEAARVIRSIGDELIGCSEEAGLAQFAQMMARMAGHEAARPWIDQIAEIDGKSREFFRLVSAQARRDQCFEVAETYYRSALDHFPIDPEFTNGLGAMLLKQDKTSEATERVAAALETHPRNADLLFLMARIQQKVGETPNATQTIRAAIKYFPDKRAGAAKFMLAQLLCETKEYDEAAGILDKMTGNDGHNPAREFRMLSTIHQKMSQITAAREAAEKAVELSPDNREYQKWLAILSR